MSFQTKDGQATGPQAKSSPPPAFVNKVLLEHRHTRFFTMEELGVAMETAEPRKPDINRLTLHGKSLPALLQAVSP